jgi:hypothetical protein
MKERGGEQDAEPRRYTYARATLPPRVRSLSLIRLTAIWEAFRVATSSHVPTNCERLSP